MYKVYQIHAPHFTAAVEIAPLKDGDGDVTGEWTVDNAAPILRYMMGWRAESVMKYVDRKGWEIQFVEEVSDE